MSVSDEIHSRLNNEKPIIYPSTPNNMKTLKRIKSKKLLEPKKSDTPPAVVLTTSSSEASSSIASKQEERHAKKKLKFATGTYNLLLNPKVLDSEDRQVLLIVLLVSSKL